MVLSPAPAGRWADLPEDIAFSIASLLQVGVSLPLYLPKIVLGWSR
jgi:hypothetical protein